MVIFEDGDEMIEVPEKELPEKEFENNETNLSENHEVSIKVEEENKPLYINDLPF